QTIHDMSVSWLAPYATVPGIKTITLSGDKEYYDSINTTRNITLRGWAKLTMQNNNNYPRGLNNIDCIVKDQESNNTIDNYNTTFFVYNSTNDLIYNESKNTISGVATYTWNTTDYNPGKYLLNCTITDNLTRYYKASQKIVLSNVTVLGSLDLDTSITETQIFRNNQTTPNKTNLSVVVLDEYLRPVENADISFESGVTLYKTCNTDINGICSVDWNPNDLSVVPNNYEITITASKTYYSGNTQFVNVDVFGIMNVSINNPQQSELLIKGTTILLDSQIVDGNGNSIATPTVIWEWKNPEDIDPTTIIAILTSDYNWNINHDMGVGNKTIIVELSKSYYRWIDDIVSSVASDAVNVTFFGHSGIDTAISQTIYGQGLHNILCRVTDNENINVTTKGIVNYPVNYYDAYNNNITYIGTNTTNSSGYSSYVWNTTDIYTILPGNHAIFCNITNQETLYYNSTKKNKRILENIADIAYNNSGNNITSKINSDDLNSANLEINNLTESWLNASFENNIIPYAVEDIVESLVFLIHNESTTEDITLFID
ncbi:MAG: hypothetical protein KAS12_03240, partial [Candidatus Aenigmarchaeota archaeon]|nr:hypothetical protein [Candidatus Aenigmarchaeota archaeon]